MAVYVFLHDDYADWELGYLLPELRSPPPDPAIEKRRYEVLSFGLERAPVRSLGGLRVTPDLSLDAVDLAALDALVLPGGSFWRGFSSPALDRLARAVVERGAVLAGICAATGYLAALGLLDAVAHASNSPAFLRERAPGYAGAAHYREALAARGGAVITASGLGAVDFTREVLRALQVYDERVCEVWYQAFKNGRDPYARA